MFYYWNLLQVDNINQKTNKKTTKNISLAKLALNFSKALFHFSMQALYGIHASIEQKPCSSWFYGYIVRRKLGKLDKITQNWVKWKNVVMRFSLVYAINCDSIGSEQYLEAKNFKSVFFEFGENLSIDNFSILKKILGYIKKNFDPSFRSKISKESLLIVENMLSIVTMNIAIKWGNSCRVLVCKCKKKNKQKTHQKIVHWKHFAISIKSYFCSKLN